MPMDFAPGHRTAGAQVQRSRMLLHLQDQLPVDFSHGVALPVNDHLCSQNLFCAQLLHACFARCVCHGQASLIPSSDQGSV